MKEANHHLKTGEKVYVAPVFPGATGDTTKPPQLFGAPAKKK
jgi:hypothetical protein